MQPKAAGVAHRRGASVTEKSFARSMGERVTGSAECPMRRNWRRKHFMESRGAIECRLSSSSGSAWNPYAEEMDFSCTSIAPSA
jgi:hypothetical protein